MRIVVLLIWGGGNKDFAILDYGGGTGLLVRLLRDVGFEAFWSDEYCQNIFARGFEYNTKIKPSLITSFEVFEHLPNPKEQIHTMLSICPNLLFSTELLPSEIPPYCGKNLWWYYGFSHGQHISFYTKKSLEIIAKSHNLHFYSYRGVHLLSQHNINPITFKLAIRLAKYGLFAYIARKMQSKTISDSIKLGG